MQKYQETVISPIGRPVVGAAVRVTMLNGAAATIYSDNGITPLSSLVTDSTGAFGFYAADGRYTVSISGNGFPTRVIADVLLEDPADGNSLLAAPGGDSLVGVIATGAGAVVETQQDINRSRIRLSSFLTAAQRTAVRTNSYTGIDMTVFTAAVQAALYAAQGHVLEIATPAFIKVNRPLVWPEITGIVGVGTPNSVLGVNLYPDLSVDWPTSYPDQGVLTADKYLYGYSGFDSITAGFWTGIGKQFQVRANLDSVNYAAHPERAPDYGIVIWCPNESTLFEHVQAMNFRKHGWLCGGVSSVPTFVHCGGYNAGASQNTIFGDAVTRTASAFGASVTVYWNVNGSTSLAMEAATSTDLDTLASGDVLTINGATYTVTGTPAATISTTERTVIAGVTTTARFYRRVTLTASLTANGRVHHAGIAFRNHPNLTFAPGVAAAAGGRGNSGSARLFGFSGDSNNALIFVDGAQTLAVVSPKAENNNSLIHVSGTQTGGGRARVEVVGYRGDGFGSADTGVVRITGSSRPSVRLGTGQINSYTNIVNDQTTGGETITVASFYGQGGLFYCKDGTEYPSYEKLRAGEMTIGDGAATTANLFVLGGGDPTNLKAMLTVANSTTRYRFRVGSTSSDVWTVDSNSGDTFHLWAYNGTATEKLVKLFNVAGVASIQIGVASTHKVGFFGATPVVRQSVSVAATDAASTQTLANSLRTALLNLGLAT